MADPEQIYQEVLSEEQGKGSASVVAEGRAKAARQRAVHGSPHPKEPKWWPGSQPQFEGGDGAAPAEAEDDEAVEEAPAAEETPAAEAPAAEEAAPAAEEERPAAAAETAAEPAADQQTAPTPEAQPAAATAPVAPAATATTPEAPPVQRPTGVTHGTPAGNRLRPEDAVATEPQFDAQQALRQRRKMIDELVSTGVPAVSARRERSGGGVGMLLLYLLIPVVAVAFLVSNQSELTAGGGEGGETVEGEGEGEGGGLTISAANVQFDKDQLTIPADGGSLQFVNDDTVEHNVAIYQDDSAQEDIFVGQVIPGGQEVTYDVPGHEPGDYYFQCDVHPAMNGTVTYE